MTPTVLTRLLLPVFLASAPLAGQAPGSCGPSTGPSPAGTRSVDVRFESGDPDLVLAGTLTLPDTPGPHPAAVLLSVAGPDDRDLTMPDGARPFRSLAQGLARLGIVTLRWDDRGVGDSEGDVLDTTLQDLADDALTAIAFLAARAEVDPGRIGAVGNSEGALVAAMAAARSDSVAFTVLLGGSGVRGVDVIRARLARQGLERGMPQERVDSLLAPLDSLAAVVLGVEDPRARREAIRRLLQSGRLQLPPYRFVPSDPEGRIELLAGPWYRSQLASDPADVLPRIRGPVLAVSGSQDRINLPEQNLPAMTRLLSEGASDSFTVTLVPNLDHFMRPAVAPGNGGPPPDFSPRVVELIGDWILDRPTGTP